MDKAHWNPTWWVIALATVAALILRCWFVAAVHIDNPVRGDAHEYVAYARNLARHKVFSAASGAMPRPDNYRDPGYPFFLSPWIATVGDPDLRYTLVQWAQALLGSLTVTAYLLLARRWLSLRWLAGCAMLLVLWPHSITMPAYLLSETLLGFLVASGLFLLAEGFARRQARWLIWGAASFSVAGLTNAVMAPFLPLLAAAACLTLSRQRWTFVLILLISLAPPACWAVRNAVVVQGPATSSRAIINLVQGSWPEYHDAWQTSVQGNPAAAATSAQIDAEVRTAVRAPWVGMTSIATRVGEQPMHYIAWYASKPARLWGWDMRIAAAPLYVFPTQNSPLDSDALMRGVVLGLKLLNPGMALLALAGCIITLGRSATQQASITALVLLHVSLVYGVFQSEPRYAVPFRGTEIVMATLALSWMVNRTPKARFWRTTSHSGSPSARSLADGTDRADRLAHSAKNPPCFRPSTPKASP
jgi:hypothetical protein